MRDINSGRIGAPTHEPGEGLDQRDWLQGCALLICVAVLVSYFFYQNSLKLEYAAVGKPQNIAEVVAETKRMDKMRQQDWQESERRRAALAEPITAQDRAGLVAIIEGGM